MNIKPYIKEVENFPELGVSFKDITSLIKEPEIFKYVIDEMATFAKVVEADYIVGPDARGFIVGCPVAYAAGKGFIPVRKKGKLPRKSIEKSYNLEYGTNTLAIHKDDLHKGDKVLITDDLLATGGTIKATIELLNELGVEIVGISFIIELKNLKGRELLNEMGSYKIKVLESY